MIACHTFALANDLPRPQRALESFVKQSIELSQRVFLESCLGHSFFQ